MQERTPEELRNSLAGEVWKLFIGARNHRQIGGFNHDMRTACAAGSGNEDSTPHEIPDDFESGCGCAEEESCDMCEMPLDDVCSVSDALDLCKKRNSLDGLSRLLTLVKAADFTAAVENYYARTGNRPMELSAPRAIDPKDKDLSEAAETFFDNIQQALDENQVLVTELDEAFDFNSMAELADKLKSIAHEQLRDEIQAGLTYAEDQLERVFGEMELINEYLKVLKDTESYPIGVLWCSEKAQTDVIKVSRTRVTCSNQMRPEARRIDPCYFWATPDWRVGRRGRAVFRLMRRTDSDLEALKDSIDNNAIKSNINKMLEQDSYRMMTAHLFTDDLDLDDGYYDVLVCRGTFKRKMLESYGVDVKAKGTMIPTEIHYSNGSVIWIEELPCYFEDYGVYTTFFRNQGDSIWGISLHDFIAPFAKMYEGVIKRMDRSVAKSTGSIVQIDSGVIPNGLESYMKRDSEGNYEISFEDDMVIEFDSTDAGMSPNFKGVPIHVTRLPHDLDRLMPMLPEIFKQIEVVTGIPSILSNGNPNSSAVRNEAAYRTAFNTANAKIASIIKMSRDTMLLPAIKIFYYHLIGEGLLKDFPTEAYPEILFDKRLELENSTARNMLNDIMPFAQMLPPEKIGGMLNEMMREAYNIDYDIFEGINPVGQAPAQQPAGPPVAA